MRAIRLIRVMRAINRSARFQTMSKPATEPQENTKLPSEDELDIPAFSSCLTEPSRQKRFPRFPKDAPLKKYR